VLKPGLYALWTVFRHVKAEIVDARGALFEHEQLATILGLPGSALQLEAVSVEAGHAGLLFRNGRHQATLGPGLYALWKGVARAKVEVVELREQTADVAGEIMTADKVTLRLNAVVTFNVADPLRVVSAAPDYRQALYREAQLALRAVVGARTLEALLGEKEAVARELDGALRTRAAELGVVVVSLGIRDVILPGEMKELMNRVIEAQKAAEAALVTRREETAAMRSQANTARLFEQNPTLMRLRELETLEKVAEKGRLSVVVGEGGLAGRIVKMV
jgi:regulator of protease activity HflC (stomatin/prohibitin superfamily)